MKARKRNSNDDWQEVEYVQLKDSYVITKADQMEFENENSVSTSTDWEQVRINAAIAAMQTLIAELYDAKSNYLFSRNIAVCSVEYADELVKQLKKK